MFIKDVIFKVRFSFYANRHFCKDFLKKYKTKKWLETRRTIVEALQRAFMVQQTSLIDNLKFSRLEGIFKLDFKVAGTDFSPKTSGNRVIFYLSNEKATIEILLVYAKGHLRKGQGETQWIFDQIKGNFPEYRHLI